MARIFLIEDDEGVREQLARLLANAGHDVAPATRFDSLADDALAAAPDLVVLDLGLPSTDGQYVARELRQRSHMPILVLTSRDSELDELASLSVGADDFVSKSSNPQLILAHVDALLRRSGAAGAGDIHAYGGLALDAARSQAAWRGRTVELTKNELRILDALIRARGAIVPREALMEDLWATDAFVDDNTLTVNINRLRQKLARAGARGIIATHRGQGYALEPPATQETAPGAQGGPADAAGGSAGGTA